MNFDKAVEAMIKEAMERGEFDDLPGKGKPIDLSAYFDTPEEVRMALRLHGATPLSANSALQIPCGLLYLQALKLTFLARRRHLF
ncbi:MAG TPA: DUF1992 domain-containing protein [Anaerolineales bacterium]|nr:DUF1992 domain-containing protein [Anaerolineales bacterium]